MSLDNRLQGFQHLGHRLDELRLLGILSLHLLDNAFYVTHNQPPEMRKGGVFACEPDYREQDCGAVIF